MTVIRREGLTWVAPRDGLAHATPIGGEYRGLCGARTIPDRFAWPIREFCAVCLTIEDGRKAAQRREMRKRKAVA